MAIPSVKLFSNELGGAIPNVMNALNQFSSNRALKDINKVKAQYAPMTTQAEAASKLAYANMMAPQFIAKIMQNPAFMANLGEEQKNVLKDLVYGAGAGAKTNQGMNAINEVPNNQHNTGIGQPSTNSFSGRIKNAFHALIGQGSQGGVNPNLQNTLQGIAHVESGGSKNPYSLVGPNTGNGNRALGKYQVMMSNVGPWTKEALGKEMSPQEFLNSPEAQEKVASYMVNKHLNKGNSPQDVGSIWFTGRPLNQAGNVRDVNGTTPDQYVNKMQEGMNQVPQKTYAQNAGDYLGTIKQGEKSGEGRAKTLDEIGKSQLGLSNSGAVLERMTNIIKNPEMQSMRDKIPFFQDKQLKFLQKTGTKEQQKLIGDFLSTAESFIASTVQGFSGKPLVREFDLAQRQKITPNDTIGVAEGKLRASIALKKIAEKKNDIIAGLLQKGVSEADAVKQANKMIDISEIEKETEKLLQDRITEDDINTTAKETGMTRQQVIARLRKEGRY